MTVIWFVSIVTEGSQLSGFGDVQCQSATEPVGPALGDLPNGAPKGVVINNMMGYPLAAMSKCANLIDFAGKD